MPLAPGTRFGPYEFKTRYHPIHESHEGVTATLVATNLNTIENSAACATGFFLDAVALPSSSCGSWAAVF